MRTLQRVGAGLFALTLFTGLAACGDDDDDRRGRRGDRRRRAAAEATTAFCDAVVEFNATVFRSTSARTSTEEEIDGRREPSSR